MNYWDAAEECVLDEILGVVCDEEQSCRSEITEAERAERAQLLEADRKGLHESAVQEWKRKERERAEWENRPNPAEQAEAAARGRAWGAHWWKVTLEEKREARMRFLERRAAAERSAMAADEEHVSSRGYRIYHTIAIPLLSAHCEGRVEIEEEEVSEWNALLVFDEAGRVIATEDMGLRLSSLANAVDDLGYEERQARVALEDDALHLLRDVLLNAHMEHTLVNSAVRIKHNEIRQLEAAQHRGRTAVVVEHFEASQELLIRAADVAGKALCEEEDVHAMYFAYIADT
eukprot:Sspe_Gene.85891::Locus_56648_Transcript_1_1_Confidence_1.000_Length_940::g.85891::m.85891